MESMLLETLRTANGLDDDSAIPTTLLSVSGGLDTALLRSSWDTEIIFMSVGVLGRMPKGAPGSLVLSHFFGFQQWRDRYSDVSRRLHEMLPNRSPETQRKLAVAWVRLALQAVDEQMADKYTMERVTLPLQLLQQSVGDLLNRARASTFDPESQKTLQGSLSQLSRAQREQSGLAGRPGGSHNSLSGQGEMSEAGAWATMPVEPTGRDLDPRTCAEPRPNLTRGSYESKHEYLETHFGLLREDFVRPLRTALEGIRAGDDLPRECRMWPHAELKGAVVGAPGGVLHCIRLASDDAEASDLDIPGGKSLMNGTLLVLSNDNFRTVRCGVVSRREAARQLGNGSIYVSLSGQTDEELRSSKTAAAAADEVAAVAPMIGQRFAVLQPGEYWGAYKPVLTALQATAALDNLPLGDCLLRCEATERAPPYLRAATAPRSRRGSQTNLAALDAERTDSQTDAGGGYDIRPILNTTSQDSPYKISDVRREWPAQGAATTSLDTWQLKAAKALLTRRLGLVQGPPGTGKTFVGLLVVRTLLRNAALWSAADGTDKSYPSSMRGSLPVSRQGSRQGSQVGSRAPSRLGEEVGGADDKGGDSDSSSSDMPEQAKLALAKHRRRELRMARREERLKHERRKARRKEWEAVEGGEAATETAAGAGSAAASAAVDGGDGAASSSAVPPPPPVPVDEGAVIDGNASSDAASGDDGDGGNDGEEEEGQPLSKRKRRSLPQYDGLGDGAEGDGRGGGGGDSPMSRLAAHYLPPEQEGGGGGGRRRGGGRAAPAAVSSSANPFAAELDDFVGAAEEQYVGGPSGRRQQELEEAEKEAAQELHSRKEAKKQLRAARRAAIKDGAAEGAEGDEDSDRSSFDGGDDEDDDVEPSAAAERGGKRREGAGGGKEGGQEGADGGEDEAGEAATGPDVPPILVLCQTNHALDQFLEGILQFEPRVVRIGGRSQSEALKKHNLLNMMEERKKKRTAVERSARKNVGDEVRRARDRLANALKQLQHAWAGAPLTPALVRHVSELRGSLGQELRRMNEEGLHEWLMVDGAARLHHELSGGGANPFGGMGGAIGGGQGRDAQFDLMTVLSQAPLTTFEVAEHCNHADAHSYRTREQTYASTLPAVVRWRLHSALKESCKVSSIREVEIAIAQYRRLAAVMAELDEAEHLGILCKAAVVGLTTTGAAKQQALVRRMGCKVLVMEEAAEVLEAHVLASLNVQSQQLLLIGDHQQLRPSAACHELTLKYGYNVSLFERSLNNDVPFVRLRTQRRMRPSIARLIAPIYPDLLDHDVTKNRPRIAGLSSCVHFITHNAPERKRDELLSPENPHEVAILTLLATFLNGMGYAPKRMTVLSAYVGQLLLLKAAFSSCGLDEVLITTVDAYQGEENDLILVSLVRSNSTGKLGFTSIDNRVCVALSRARLGFFCACDLPMLSSGSDLWEKVMRSAVKERRAGPTLPLLTNAAIAQVEHDKKAAAEAKLRQAMMPQPQPQPQPQDELAVAQAPPAIGSVAPSAAAAAPAIGSVAPLAAAASAPAIGSAPPSSGDILAAMEAARAAAARLSAGMIPAAAAAPASMLPAAPSDSVVAEQQQPAAAAPLPPVPSQPQQQQYPQGAMMDEVAYTPSDKDDDDDVSAADGMTPPGETPPGEPPPAEEPPPPAEEQPTGSAPIGAHAALLRVAPAPPSLPPSPAGDGVDEGAVEGEATAAAADVPAPVQDPPMADTADATATDADAAVCPPAPPTDAMAVDLPSPDANEMLRITSDPLPVTWPEQWQCCLEVLTDLSQDTPDIFPRCGRILPNGQKCVRTVHVLDGSIECASESPLVSDQEYQRWRPLREAIATRREGNLPSPNAVVRAKKAAEKKAAEKKAADAAEAARQRDILLQQQRKRENQPKKLEGGLGLVGYNAAPARVRMQSLFEDNLRRKGSAVGGSFGASASASQPSASFAAAADDGMGSSGAGGKRPRMEEAGGGGASSSGGVADPREAMAIAAGWAQGFSKSQNRPFWRHKASDQTVWSLDKIDFAGSAGAAASAASSGGKRSKKKGGSKPLWKESFSTTRQKTFWVHRETKETTWRKPPDHELGGEDD